MQDQQAQSELGRLLSDAAQTVAAWIPEPGTLDFDSAAELTSIIKAMPLTAEQKASLCEKVKQSCMSTATMQGERTGRVKGQCYLNLPNYFSKAFWRHAPNLSCGQRFSYVLSVAIRGGARVLSEHSKALIMVLSLGSTWDRVGQDRALQWETYKALNKEIKKRMQGLPPPAEVVRVLPPSWQQLPDELKANLEFCPALKACMSLLFSNF